MDYKITRRIDRRLVLQCKENTTMKLERELLPKNFKNLGIMQAKMFIFMGEKHKH